MNPRFRPTPGLKKVPKGFFLVNLPESDQNELRSLAKEFGLKLRDVIAFKMRGLKYELMEKLNIARKLGVNPLECQRYIESNPKN